MEWRYFERKVDRNVHANDTDITVDRLIRYIYSGFPNRRLCICTDIWRHPSVCISYCVAIQKNQKQELTLKE